MAEAKKSVFINNVVSPVGRLAYPHLGQPDNEGTYADGKYKCTLLIPKSAGIDSMKKAVQECAQQAFPGVPLKALALPFRDGDKKGKEDFTDCVYVTVKTKRPPMLVDRAKQRIDANELYAGCKVRLVLTAMSYVGSEKVRNADGEIETVESKGITFLLEVVQKVDDGEPIVGSAGGAALGALDALEDDATDDTDDMLM